MNLFGTSLIITAIGMGLVFIAILILWALMEVIVKINAGKDDESEGEEVLADASAESKQTLTGGDLHARAAAAAVAVAISLRKRVMATQTAGAGNDQPDSPSLWQAAGRIARVNRSSRVRK